MATTRNRAGRFGTAFIAASFLAGLGGAAVIVVEGWARPVDSPYFGLAVEPAGRPADPPRTLTADAGRAASPPAAANVVVVADSEPVVESPAPGDARRPEPTPPASPGGETAPLAGRPGPVAEARPPLELPPPHLPAPLVPPEDQFREPVHRPPPREPVIAAAPPAPDVAAPLPPPPPEAATADADDLNSFDVPGPQAAARVGSPGRLLERFTERRSDGWSVATDRAAGVTVADRLRQRLRGDGRLARALGDGEPTMDEAAVTDGWPTPDRLLDQLDALASGGRPADVEAWAGGAIAAVGSTLDSAGPLDPEADPLLVALGETAAGGMRVADACPEPVAASETRRAAIAIARRVAVWRAVAAWCDAAESRADGDVAVLLVGRPVAEEARRLLCFVERYETSRAAADAAVVKATLDGIVETSGPRAAPLVQAVTDHYLAPNVRIAVHRTFVERMLPEATVTNGAVQDFVLGRPVRGRSTVEQSMAVQFVPHAGEIRMVLVVNGEVASRTVTASGPVTLHSRGQASFTVFKPIRLTPAGLAIDAARGTASSTAQLADIETSFDALPIMGPLVRTIARNQHDESRAEASREVNGKIVGRACREVDQQSEPKLGEMAERIRERAWQPLVTLGLDPTAVALETTEDVATARLRLAAPTQLAAHTPRPRAPADALVSMQLHDTVANNALGRFGLEGRRLELPDLARLVCERLGIEPQVPDDLPDGVAVTFAATDPLRVECRDGLVHVRVALETLESGRRSWYDLVARVAYRPVVAGPQVFLEREGPVQIGGPGHEGRIELALRTIFGKIFAKERPVPLVPAKVTDNPRLAGLAAVQAVATDGWLAIALAAPEARPAAGAAGTSPTATAPAPAKPGILRR